MQTRGGPAIDYSDHQSIGLLRKDARTTIATPAAKFGGSRAAIGHRLRKLQNSQVIVGYGLRLRSDAPPVCIRARMQVRVGGHQTLDAVANLSRFSLNVPAADWLRTALEADACSPKLRRSTPLEVCSGSTAAVGVADRVDAQRPAGTVEGSLSVLGSWVAPVATTLASQGGQSPPAHRDDG